MLKNIILLAAFAGIVSVTACKKTEPCKAIITVVDTLGRPVVGATVVLRQDSVVNAQTGVRADLFQEQLSTGTGEAFFEFKWEAVFKCRSIKRCFISKGLYPLRAIRRS